MIAETIRRKWDAYARRSPHDEAHVMAPAMQRTRTRVIADRCVGSVLDVGGGDGYIAKRIAEDHDVRLVDISPIRVARAAEAGIPSEVGDAAALRFGDATFDTVVVAETLEHLENPGAALAEAFRVAHKRVVMSIPLDGWADPTHEWRIRLDELVDTVETHPTKRRQIVLTWERGSCWPDDYHTTDPEWAALFEDR